MRKKDIWLSTVERLEANFCLELHEFLAAETPQKTKYAKKIPGSRVHQ